MTRQTGGHMRLTTTERGQHHVTVPNHKSLKVGTLAKILADVAEHFQITRDDVQVSGLLSALEASASES